jgi:hypothetical protein
VTTYARSGTSSTWHRLTDRYAFICGQRVRYSVCGEELLAYRTQMVSERPEHLCATCEKGARS